MSSGHTNYCSLNQWQASDKVLRTEFNEDNQKTDTALSGLDSRIKSLEGRITLGSYVGTGNYGMGSNTSLTFPSRPVLVVILGRSSCFFPGQPDEGNAPSVSGDSSGVNMFTWSGNTLTWLNYGSSFAQLNEKGLTYRYIALYL